MDKVQVEDGQYVQIYDPDRSALKEPNWTEDTVILKLPDKKRGVPIPVSVWLTHADFVEPIIAKLRPLVIVEVGVFTGASLLTMRAFARYHGINCQLFGIDSWIGANSGSEGWVWDGQAVYDKLRARTKNYRNVTLLRMDSEQGTACIPDGSVDLFHLDADHREPAVRRDLELWLPKLAPHSVVLMHDIGMVTKECQVWKVWREIQRKYPTYSDTRAAGLGAFAPRGIPLGLTDLFKRAIVI